MHPHIVAVYIIFFGKITCQIFSSLTWTATTVASEEPRKSPLPPPRRPRPRRSLPQPPSQRSPPPKRRRSESSCCCLLSFSCNGNYTGVSLSLSYPRFDESSDDDDRSDGDGDFKVIVKKPRYYRDIAFFFFSPADVGGKKAFFSLSDRRREEGGILGDGISRGKLITFCLATFSGSPLLFFLARQGRPTFYAVLLREIISSLVFCCKIMSFALDFVYLLVNSNNESKHSFLKQMNSSDGEDLGGMSMSPPQRAKRERKVIREKIVDDSGKKNSDSRILFLNLNVKC